jgi:two-component sensor histidine kinase
VRIEGPAILLEPNTAQAFAVALHELATNAGKYGSLSSNKGQVALKWHHGVDRELVLRWTETGDPPAEPPARKGFVSRVIVGLIKQLKGTVRFDWHRSGLVCEISIRV